MTYRRVIPRDLFNEANLLKCIGQLVLLVEDGRLPWLSYHHDGEAFNIEQNEGSGGIFVTNVQFWIAKKLVHFERPLNSRMPWPLYLETLTEAHSVFDEKGTVIINPDNIEL